MTERTCPITDKSCILFLTFDDRRCRIVYNNKNDRIHFEIRIEKIRSGGNGDENDFCAGDYGSNSEAVYGCKL